MMSEPTIKPIILFFRELRSTLIQIVDADNDNSKPRRQIRAPVELLVDYPVDDTNSVKAT